MHRVWICADAERPFRMPDSVAPALPEGAACVVAEPIRFVNAVVEGLHCFLDVFTDNSQTFHRVFADFSCTRAMAWATSSCVWRHSLQTGMNAALRSCIFGMYVHAPQRMHRAIW